MIFLEHAGLGHLSHGVFISNHLEFLEPRGNSLVHLEVLFGAVEGAVVFSLGNLKIEKKYGHFLMEKNSQSFSYSSTGEVPNAIAEADL